MERKITVYSASGWASCDSVKEFLSHHKISFTDRNVAEDPTAMEELVQKIGRRSTPVIVVEGEVIAGFDRGKLERLLGLERWKVSDVPNASENSSFLILPSRVISSIALIELAFLSGWEKRELASSDFP